ncbi:kyphoscoliosis peptidase [Lethenteron reissneri]|uniref:kyphoscoliosis peptidase n=1 Tax=Lethenteron reissneri TaxID=7753 RepID=UPI002AB6EA16|nr:kyphoscoliosis peptidase [Lethenteron reissneri]
MGCCWSRYCCCCPCLKRNSIDSKLPTSNRKDGVVNTAFEVQQSEENVSKSSKVDIQSRGKSTSRQSGFQGGKNNNRIDKTSVEIPSVSITNKRTRQEVAQTELELHACDINNVNQGRQIDKAQSVKGYSEAGLKHKDVKDVPIKKVTEFQQWKSPVPNLDIFKNLDQRVIKMDFPRSYSTTKIVEMITQDTQTELEKLRAIWIWVCHNIEYDVKYWFGKSKSHYKKEDVLSSRTAICAGYAGLVYEMCRHVGVECEEVIGYGKTLRHGPFQLEDSNHAWNAVRIGGRWHLLDACWGAGAVSDETQSFTRRYNEFYFLTDPKQFVESHWPEISKWQLMEHLVSREDFEYRVLKEVEFFKLELKLAMTDHWIVNTVNGVAEVMVVNSKGPLEYSYTLTKVETKSESTKLSKSHGLMSIQRDNMKLHIFPPQRGDYNLSIFAAEANKSGKYSLDCVCSFKIHCENPGINPVEMLQLSHHCGPGLKTEALGLHSPSQPSPIIYTPDGRCEVAFQKSANQCVNFTASLIDKSGKKCANHVIIRNTPNEISLVVRLPEPGNYQLQIFENTSPEAQSFNFLCDYVIVCSAQMKAFSWPPFPQTYGNWSDLGCVLIEPLAGVLPPDRKVQFAVSVPTAVEVVVETSGGGSSRVALEQGSSEQSEMWHGEITTGGVKSTVNVMAMLNSRSRMYQYILSYDVE